MDYYRYRIGITCSPQNKHLEFELYAAHRTNPTVNSNDNVFTDAIHTQYKMLNPVSNGSGGYDATLTIGIAVPVTGVINLEPETGGQFKLGQNDPNPFRDVTTIPFNLTNPSQVKIEIFDMNGRKVLDLIDRKMESGEQKIHLDRQHHKNAMPEGNYVFQLTVENNNVIFRQCKVMTVH